MRTHAKLMLPLMFLMLSGCASTTPIAVSTPHWQVPPPDPELRQQETAAVRQAEIALSNWSKMLSNLPGQPAQAKPLF